MSAAEITAEQPRTVADLSDDAIVAISETAERFAWDAVRRANGGVPFNVEHDERTCGLCSTGYTKACAESRGTNVDKSDCEVTK